MPSALVTRAMMDVRDPSFAGLMSTVIVSPAFSELLVTRREGVCLARALRGPLHLAALAVVDDQMHPGVRIDP